MLGLVAGRGLLPLAVVEAAAEDVKVAALSGFDPTGITPDLSFRLETLGSLPRRLKELGVTKVCFAGGIERPAVDPSAIDAETLPLVPRIMAALQAGDDAALRELMTIFEEAGLPVVAATEIARDLLPQPGVLTKTGPSEGDEADARRGAEVVVAMGAADIGQSCAILKGQVLATEGVFGTDWMLASLAARPDASGGILYKAPKPDQDRRADLPVIGPDTVAAVRAAGLGGIVLEAGGVMILDRETTLRLADEADVFVWVRTS